jgi:hypothetical protein
LPRLPRELRWPSWYATLKTVVCKGFGHEVPIHLRWWKGHSSKTSLTRQEETRTNQEHGCRQPLQLNESLRHLHWRRYATVACLADPLSPITTPIVIFTFFVYHIKPQNFSLIDEYFFRHWESGSTKKKGHGSWASFLSVRPVFDRYYCNCAA